MTTKKKATIKKKTNTEFKVRAISNGYTVTIWDTESYVEDKIIYCLNRAAVLATIEGLIF